MVYNTLWFPKDFYLNTAGEAISSAASATEVAIANLQQELRETALRQAYLRRLAAEARISSRSRDVLTIDGLMRLTVSQSSSNQISSPDANRQQEALKNQGTFAMYCGGWSDSGTSQRVSKLTYLSKIASDLGNKLIPSYGGKGLSSPTLGYILCGYNFPRGDATSIQEVAHADGTATTLGQKTNQKHTLGATVGTKTSGFILSGAPDDSFTYTSSGEEFTYTPKQVALLGSTFQARYQHSHAQNKTNGIIGAARIYPGGIPYPDIEDFNMASKTVSILGAKLSSERSAGAAAGNEVKALFMLGMIGWFGSYPNETDEFIFASKTFSFVGKIFNNGKWGFFCEGSSLKAYPASGSDLNRGVLTEVNEVDYTSRQVAILGTSMNPGARDGAGFADYNGGIA